MALASTQSFSRIQLIIPQHYMVSSDHEKRFLPVKPMTKNTKKSSNFLSKFSPDKSILTVENYGEISNFSRSSIYNRHMLRNSIKASSQVESAGSDRILGKIQDESVVLDQLLSKVGRFGVACFNFTRPVALLHAVVSTISLFARVLVENPQLFEWPLLFKAFPGLLAIIFANAYNIGINQIFDLDIDRINKPYLPLAAGDLSPKQAWFLVIFNILSGLSIFRLMNADVVTTSIYCLGLFLATFYSAPPFRFKGSSIATAIVLPLNAGILQNVGVLYATRSLLGLPFWWSPSIVFITTFATLHFVVVSITKDLTDVEGDLKSNIRTFAAIYGPRTIAFIGAGIQLVNLIGAIAAAIYMPQAFKRHVMLPFHLISALWLIYQVGKLDKANYAKEESTSFYVSLWKLNILEFLLFPFM